MWVPIVYVPSEPGAALGQPRRDRALEPTPGPRELAPPHRLAALRGHARVGRAGGAGRGHTGAAGSRMYRVGIPCEVLGNQNYQPDQHGKAVH